MHILTGRVHIRPEQIAHISFLGFYYDWKISQDEVPRYAVIYRPILTDSDLAVCDMTAEDLGPVIFPEEG